ncbi:MAG: hypothetical protein KF838_05150 [Phycisphaeraceae bacterium]|nr:MAG: hypothetical protein KF838_05150 [Phycisphaeraceae bacterium]
MRSATLLASIRRAAIVHAAGLAALASIIAAGYFLGVKPVEGIRERQSMLRVALRARSEDEAEIRRKARDAEAALRQAEESLRLSGVSLQPTSHLNTKIRDIAALAAEHNIEVDALNAQPPISDPQFLRVPVRLAGRAAAQNVSEFMRSINDRFSDVAVRSFDLRADLTTGGGWSTVQLEIDWYAAKSERDKENPAK